MRVLQLHTKQTTLILTHYSHYINSQSNFPIFLLLSTGTSSYIMLKQTIFILGLITITISAQNTLPNESQKTYPPPVEQSNATSSQQFTLEALMQISRGTEKFSLELYKVIALVLMSCLILRTMD